ncbi:hypothetical protein EN786_34465 [Mesorhizobium sp. M4B.F.Ca.ET.143.01.1.1]|nr:hypothetical protein EOA31_25900 [Mesorhizobium sp. M4B.F.Ca.ET.049.02.1.2]TGV18235.1 hypothetical protein EN786_34465 [Mesorhizobium sp. M4B.F.Ca.ET.143.01.1.1]
MSRAVEPPILPRGSPDRDVNCEVALEAAIAALMTTSEAQGWTKIATERAQQLGLLPAEPPRWRMLRARLIASAALLLLLCAVTAWWVLR